MYAIRSYYEEYFDSKQKVEDTENQIESIAREFRITANSEYEYILVAAIRRYMQRDCLLMEILSAR